MPAAGKYRTMIAVERTAPGTTAAGATVDNWTELLKRRCKLRPATVRDQLAADVQHTVLITHVIEVRRDSLTATIKQEMRVRLLSRVVGAPRILHIESIVDGDDQGLELHLRCVERSVPQ